MTLTYFERLLRELGLGGFQIRDAESAFELLALVLLEDRAALVRTSARRNRLVLYCVIL